MSGTDLAYQPPVLDGLSARDHQVSALSAYARAMRCPDLLIWYEQQQRQNQKVVAPDASPMRCPLSAYGSPMRCPVLRSLSSLRTCYGLSGTEVQYGATRCLAERTASGGSKKGGGGFAGTRPPIGLRAVRYWHIVGCEGPTRRVLRACYALSGTDVHAHCSLLSAYARATRCPVLTCCQQARVVRARDTDGVVWSRGAGLDAEEPGEEVTRAVTWPGSRALRSRGAADVVVTWLSRVAVGVEFSCGHVVLLMYWSRGGHEG
eukprot:1646286-Rhodomonas_salina.3